MGSRALAFGFGFVRFGLAVLLGLQNYVKLCVRASPVSFMVQKIPT